MPTDLFNDDLGSLDNEELYAAIEEFAAIQPVEGWRHDYAQAWSDSALQKIAAFAHGFGGVLLVGVKKQKGDVSCEFLGVDSAFEYKTRIASSIASNISPIPSYDVFECYKPGAAQQKFCVVRVRQSKSLHLITKKGLSPIFVRNEDETVPANADQLRRLIDREREIPELGARTTARLNQLRDGMMVGCGYQGIKDSNQLHIFDSWHILPHQNSQTFVKLELVPSETLLFELEKTHEDQFRNLVLEFYPRIGECIRRGIAYRAVRRGVDFYDFAFYHASLDYEVRWRASNFGGIGFASQMTTDGKFWSVVDLAHYLILFFKLATRWCEFIRYFGDGNVRVQLNIPGLNIRCADGGYYVEVFDPSNRNGIEPRDIRKDAILLGTTPSTAASAQNSVNYFSIKENLAKDTVSLLNQLLRCLGHAVAMDLMRESVDLIAFG